MRLAVARDAGLNEATIAKIDRAETSDLAAHHKAAIALADAMMTQPAQLAPELRDELHRHFTAAQLVELTLDVMKWNYQKVSVALGTDAEVTPGQLTDLEFDANGNWVRPH